MLEIEDLRKRYGDTIALDGLSLSVARGTVCGFVGQNGAGKTTAMRIVLGVLAADSGEVRWQGRPMNGEARRRTGYMPEERGLYPKMAVRDQLTYLARLHGLSPTAAAAAADELLEQLGLPDRAKARIEALSLGNQQRVQLAAALVHDPDLLVLDEPFSGLDPVGVDVLAGVLRTRVQRGVPVLFSSHQLDLVERLCDSVAIVKAGRVVAQGDVDDLRSRGRARRIRVRTEAAASWAVGLPGVTILPTTNGYQLLELADDTDDQAVLDAARRSGAVHQFTPERPSLTDLFREVVGA